MKSLELEKVFDSQMFDLIPQGKINEKKKICGNSKKIAFPPQPKITTS